VHGNFRDYRISDLSRNEGVMQEQAKYEEMWRHPQYRQIAPGEQIAQHFLGVAKPRGGSTIIDFGCGTGRGGLVIAMLGQMGRDWGFKVKLLDFAENCLDDEVREAVQLNPGALEFHQVDLSKRVPFVEEYGYCTDVMEHIPPDDVDRVLQNILQAAQHVFFQISCVDDACGKLIGEPLHLSVHPPSWWLSKFVEMKCQVHYWKDDQESCLAYVTAWATGRDITEKGELNVEEQTILANVRANSGDQTDPDTGEIKELRAQGCKLVTLNGAYNWALRHGLVVSSTVVCDARPFNARFTHPVAAEPQYLICSQCDPSVLAGLPRERTWLWNTSWGEIQPILEELVGPGKWFGVYGGCTVLLRAIPLLRMLGYCKFHLFGCDSCVQMEEVTFKPYQNFKTSGGTVHHAYEQPENDQAPIFATLVGGRRFYCTAWQIAQGTEFIELIRQMGNEFDLAIYGDGLLRWILEHGAKLDIEREEREVLEAARTNTSLSQSPT
jgi:SAM-dependent methyltransferase